MAYTSTDPRSTLPTSSAGAPRSASPNIAPQYFEFARSEPTEVTPGGSRSWWMRSQAIVGNYVEPTAGDTVERTGQVDEYVVMFTEPMARATIEAGGERVDVAGRTLAIVPPGDSAIHVATDTPIVRLFSTQDAALAARAVNASVYVEPDPHVAPFVAWPEPPEGFRIRCYDVDAVAPEQGRFGRMWRCTTLMVNWFYDAPGPRPADAMSPHHHDDFEQLSLQLGGDYVHHIRTPWTTDMRTWRDDEHRHCTSPSITVIPPPAVHTSQAVGDTSHFLVDIFAPPRADFSAKPGWVLNADEYPVP